MLSPWVHHFTTAGRDVASVACTYLTLPTEKSVWPPKKTPTTNWLILIVDRQSFDWAGQALGDLRSLFDSLTPMQTATGAEARDDSSNAISIGALPDELLGLVFSFLPCVRRWAASSVCTRWHAVATDHTTAAGPLCGPRHRGHPQEGLAILIENAASEGHAVCLSYLLDRHGHRDGAFGWRQSAARAAAKRGHVLCLDYLVRAGRVGGVALDTACESGNADSISYLCKTARKAPRWEHILCAIIHGSVDDVSCLYGARAPDTYMSEYWFDGKHPIYKDIYKRCRGEEGAYACAVAALHGHADVFAWLVRAGCVPDANACIEAARGGHLDCLKYAREHGAPWDEHACSAAALGVKGKRDGAAASRRMDCLVYARANGCPADVLPCYVAAKRGDFNSLRRAREAGCPWDARVTAAAASAGSRACLYYAHEQGCEWDGWVCVYAAARGALKILVYAHRHGCPYDLSHVAWAAVRGGQRRCLDYVINYMQ